MLLRFSRIVDFFALSLTTLVCVLQFSINFLQYTRVIFVMKVQNNDEIISKDTLDALLNISYAMVTHVPRLTFEVLIFIFTWSVLFEFEIFKYFFKLHPIG